MKRIFNFGRSGAPASTPAATAARAAASAPTVAHGRSPVPAPAPTAASAAPPPPAPTAASAAPPPPAPTAASAAPPPPAPSTAPPAPPSPAPSAAPAAPPSPAPSTAPEAPPSPAPSTAPEAPPSPAPSTAPEAPPVTTLTLPRLLYAHPSLSASVDYFISPDDIVAAIREDKHDFIALLLNNDKLDLDGKTREEQLWEKVNEFVFQRLTSHLVYTIKEQQKRIIIEYKRTLGSSPIDIGFLNTSLALTVSEGQPIYTASIEAIYEKYINQLLSSSQDRDTIKYNGTPIPLAELRAKITPDIKAYLSACRASLKIQYSPGAAIDLQAEIKKLTTDASRALATYNESSKRYQQALDAIEGREHALVDKAKALRRFTENFTRLAPSIFIRALEERGLRAGQVDFQQKLARIFFSTTFTSASLEIYLDEALRSGSPRAVDLLAGECIGADIDPLKLEVDDDTRSSLHLIAGLAMRAASTARPTESLVIVLEKFKALLGAAYKRYYASALETIPDADAAATEARKELLSAFLVKNADKTALGMLIEVDKIGLLLTIRDYITPKIISEALSTSASEFQRKAYEHLQAYDAKLSLLERGADVRSQLGKKAEAFDRTASPPDNPYNRLLQRRKALETLRLTLWLANALKMDEIFIEQTRMCAESCKRYSEPGAIFSRGDALTPALAELVRRRTNGGVGGAYTASGVIPARGGAGATSDTSDERLDSHAQSLLSSTFYGSRDIAPDPTEAGVVIVRECRDMALASTIEALLLPPISDYKKDGFSLSELDKHQKNLQGLAHDIYHKVLSPYRYSSSSQLLFGISRWDSSEKWVLQKKHMSRMAEALELIAKATTSRTNLDQERVIHLYLLEALRQMVCDLEWITPAATIHTLETRPLDKVLEIDGGRVKILSPTIAADITLAKHKAEMDTNLEAYKRETDERLRRIEERFAARLEEGGSDAAPSAGSGLRAYSVFSAGGGGGSHGVELTGVRTATGVPSRGVARASTGDKGGRASADDLGVGHGRSGARGGAGAGAGGSATSAFSFSRRG